MSITIHQTLLPHDDAALSMAFYRDTLGFEGRNDVEYGGTFERLQSGDAEVVQEPTEQPYGARDCAFRDPAGTPIRIQELR
jgi:uncharacterized glyoxalase superfamily protein PhnB